MEKSKTFDLCQKLVELYGHSEDRIVTAESCTSGLIAGAITEIPGASKIYDRGYITYSNDAKVEDLGVPRDLIDQHGAVSKEVAHAMAERALEKADATIALSVTGIAGPTGGSDKKPVGLVYIGYQKKGEQSHCHEFVFDGDRHAVREQTIQEALKILINKHQS